MTDDNGLREYPPLIEAVRELAELTGEPFEVVMDREVAWAVAHEAAAVLARAAAKNPTRPLDAPDGPAVRAFRKLLK